MKKVLYEAAQHGGILLNANESPYNVTEAILQEISDALNNISFHRYPDDAALPLRQAYASYLGVPADCVMAGNGSDEMIGLLVGLTISEGKKVYTLDPDFSMYDYYTGMHNGEMITYHYEMDQAFDAADFIIYGKQQNIDMVLFSNPNNPTGRIIDIADLIKIVEAFPDKPVVIDEAYGEFADQTMLPYLTTYPNLIILRTMSKAFGMAAVRCGFLITCSSTMDQIRPYKVPYNVNALTQCVAEILLQHSDEMKERIEECKASRDAFYQTVSDMKLKDFTLYPSKANYLYGTSIRKADLLEELQKRNVTIRDYKDGDAFRITIGTPAENALVLAAIQAVYKEEC